MKKLNVGMALLAVAVCAMLSFSPLKAYAGTVTLTLESASYSDPSGEYVYPYNFRIDGSANTSPLMCLDFYNHISFGESWTATITPIAGNTLYEEAAYIFSLASASGASADTVAEAQWANWNLFQTQETRSTFLTGTVPLQYQSSVSNMLDTAATYVQGNPNSSLYSQYTMFVPEAGSQSEGGAPQDFIGVAPTPEPGSLILLGTGMLGFAAFLYRRRRVA